MEYAVQCWTNWPSGSCSVMRTSSFHRDLVLRRNLSSCTSLDSLSTTGHYTTGCSFNGTGCILLHHFVVLHLQRFHDVVWNTWYYHVSCPGQHGNGDIVRPPRNRWREIGGPWCDWVDSIFSAPGWWEWTFVLSYWCSPRHGVWRGGIRILRSVGAS